MAQNIQQYFPNWKDADIHGEASKIGYFNQHDENICYCCQNKIQKQEIPLCDNTKKLEFLGFGFPLFYMFLRNCMILLILLIISNNFISLFISIQDGNNHCGHLTPIKTGAHSPHGVHQIHHSILHFSSEAEAVGEKVEHEVDPLDAKCRNFMLLMSRNDKVQKDYETIFRIGSFIIHVLGLLYIKDKILKTLEYYDQIESDLSDYAALVKEIPQNLTGISARLNNFFREKARYEGNKPYQIHQIILLPDSEQLHHLQQHRNHAIQKALEENQHGKGNLQTYLNDVYSVGQKIEKETNHMMHEVKNDTIKSENAIIIFETEPEKIHFLQHFEEIKTQGAFNNYLGNNLENFTVEQAPQPKQIIYQNLKYHDQKLANLAKGWGLSFLFLTVITVIFYFISILKSNFLDQAIEQAEQHPDSAATKKTIATIIAWVTLLGIVFFNKFVMGNVLHYFTHLEKHDNKAHEDFSFAFKYALGMFFTTALMTIAVEALKYKNYYTHDFGVIEEETIMFFLCAFLVPLIWAIHPLQQCHVRHRHHHHGHNDVTQHEANHLMADYHYDMGKRYAQIIQMMWFTFLYADLIPIGAFLILIGFAIYYWIDKYNLLRRSSLESNISGDLAVKALFLLDLTLLWRFLGQIIFDIQIRDGLRPLSIIFFCLSIIYLLVPWNSVLDLINPEDFKLNEKTYSSQQHRFRFENYKTYHSLYKEDQKSLLKGILKHGQSLSNKNNANVLSTLLNSNLPAQNNFPVYQPNPQFVSQNTQFVSKRPNQSVSFNYNKN